MRFPQVGDRVQLDELVAEVENDKANIEISSPCNGVISELFVDEKAEVAGGKASILER